MAPRLATAAKVENDTALAKADALRDLIAVQRRGDEIKSRILDTARAFDVDRATVWRWLRKDRAAQARSSPISEDRSAARRNFLHNITS